eukprot:1900443-Alexandrium_andersonii.AAC.1
MATPGDCHCPLSTGDSWWPPHGDRMEASELRANGGPMVHMVRAAWHCGVHVRCACPAACPVCARTSIVSRIN